MSLFYYYGLLRKKQEQLQRLQDCQSQLQGIKQEYLNYNQTVTTPELTSTTWQGSLANKFEDIRTEGILVSYQDLESTQLSNAFSTINSKMSSLKSEILSLKQTIHSLELEMLEDE
ncbi:YwqH-like family protein [Metabacillus halosaccharovorans]|uniref:YwqH-like family protein n=1 Tax=Metabacillus halosaccharovorans TaxID=930124 RepID=UPI001C1F47CA|nr:DUF5082 family protein [Metabacillus halosaccharovorans]MBU7594388.1 DUF5082 domain-containing protein [Metabacillus halosaccharovorans]